MNRNGKERIMIVKMTNKDEKFYEYMGKFFGSRIVQRQTNDRMYDDDDKQWYLYLEDEKVKAFVAVSKNVIKNVYGTKDEYLEEILKKVKEEVKITCSTVTNCYADVYEKCGFQVSKSQVYKNFITIYSQND